MNLEINYKNKENENSIMDTFIGEANTQIAAKTKNPMKKIKLEKRDISCTIENIKRIMKIEFEDIIVIINKLQA